MSFALSLTTRVRDLRRERGWTLEELASRAETSFSTIHKLERSQRKLSTQWIERLAKAFEMTPEEFIGQRAQPLGVSFVPLIGHIAAGNWREAIQEPLGHVPAVGVDAAAFALKAVGDSMDKLVPDGGYVIVDPTSTGIHDGRLYAVMNSEGETTVKRYRPDPARLEPCSTNPAHQPIELGRESFSIIGRVVGAYQTF